MADESVYDQISELLDREEASIDSQEQVLDVEHQKQIDAADSWLQEAVGPLQARRAQLETVRETVKGLVEQVEAEVPMPDPSAPADTTPDPGESSPETPTETPASTGSSESPSSDPTAPIVPATDEQPSESGFGSSPDSPITAEPAGAATAVTADLAANVDPATPVVLSSPTSGDTIIAPAADVVAANDASVPDADLTEQAKIIRNSDFA